MPEHFEEGDAHLIPENEPQLRDVIKIDGRWAQLLGGGGSVRFLDTLETTTIDLEQYKLAKKFGCTVQNLPIIFKGEGVPEEELQNIYWGPEEKEYPHLKTIVKVFGEYEKIKE